jgi:HAD superfamily hydrolase (TIGR01493 family)
VNPAALVFDAYGTLFDVASVATACAHFATEPDALVSLWRAKQLEYSFLRSLIGPAAYVDFGPSQVTHSTSLPKSLASICRHQIGHVRSMVGWR